MQKGFYLLVVMLSLLVIGVFRHSNVTEAMVDQSNDRVFLFSLTNALLAGEYGGGTTFGELRQHGDFGLGTTAELNGEVVILDGKFYEITATGKTPQINDSVRAPFAAVKFFSPEQIQALKEPLTFQQLEQRLNTFIPTKNRFYAIKIQGVFSYIKARSSRRQTKPYRPLAEALKDAAIFEFRNIRGTMVGFYTPGYMNVLHSPTYHFHFISDTRQGGGHVLECQLQNVSVAIDSASQLELELPSTQEFYKADLSNPPQPQ
jgi:acetolactate decarboxylase